ncbi:MAG: PIN domain-containing protein [Verrucomicrobia bacterium]|nr:PIN domain-containing protein [Verrucomicrobiota bacterium]
MGLIEDIGSGPVCLDTSVFIYFIEEDPHYIDIVTPIFEVIDVGLLSAVTSGITLLETLVVPLRKKDNVLALQYEQLLSESRGLKLLELDRHLLRKASELRATLHIKTPDALQIAAALQEGCTAFVTNDRRLPKISNLNILQLSDYSTI